MPGIRAESLRLASSRVRSFSSAVRGGPLVLSCPLSHSELRNVLMYESKCGSSRNALTVSRSFLWSRKR